jgi:YfiH family protein
MHDQGLEPKKACGCPKTRLHFSNIRTPVFSDLHWNRKDLRYFTYPVFSDKGAFRHGVFTRHGGVSEHPYKSLNTSASVGDRPESVEQNLRMIRQEIGAKRLFSMEQVHGDDLVVLRGGHQPNLDRPFSADATITNIPGLALLVKQADCQSVIIYEPKKHVVANVHCGWRGNVKDILGKVVKCMKSAFGCEESYLMAAIGPSLGPCCAEFVDFEKLFPTDFERFMVRQNYFDLWAVSCSQLLNAGLQGNNIELAGICTRCRTDLFFSYRGEGKTGRFGTVAMLA